MQRDYTYDGLPSTTETIGTNNDSGTTNTGIDLLGCDNHIGWGITTGLVLANSMGFSKVITAKSSQIWSG